MKPVAAELFLKQYSGKEKRKEKKTKTKKERLFKMLEKLEMVKLHKGFASSGLRPGSVVCN